MWICELCLLVMMPVVLCLIWVWEHGGLFILRGCCSQGLLGTGLGFIEVCWFLEVNVLGL